MTNTKEYREYQILTYSEEDKKNEYRKYIMEHGTPEQIEAFHKIKQAKTYAQVSQKVLLDKLSILSLLPPSNFLIRVNWHTRKANDKPC